MCYSITSPRSILLTPSARLDIWWFLSSDVHCSPRQSYTMKYLNPIITFLYALPRQNPRRRKLKRTTIYTSYQIQRLLTLQISAPLLQIAVALDSSVFRQKMLMESESQRQDAPGASVNGSWGAEAPEATNGWFPRISNPTLCAFQRHLLLNDAHYVVCALFDFFSHHAFTKRQNWVISLCKVRLWMFFALA